MFRRNDRRLALRREEAPHDPDQGHRMTSAVHRQRLTLRALAALLSYPGAERRAALPEIEHALEAERALPR
jgi:hypothetical protein